MNKIVLILYISLFIFSSTTSASKLFSDSEINEMISEVASNYSKNLPQTLDQTTILEGVFAGGNRNIVYIYKLILDVEELEETQLSVIDKAIIHAKSKPFVFYDLINVNNEKDFRRISLILIR